MSDVDDLLRQKFTELCAQRDAILTKSGPLREKRDAAIAKARAAEDKLTRDVKDAESGLFDLNNEIAKVARALRPAGSHESKTAG